jgi:hypothetical protein
MRRPPIAMDGDSQPSTPTERRSPAHPDRPRPVRPLRGRLRRTVKDQTNTHRQRISNRHTDPSSPPSTIPTSQVIPCPRDRGQLNGGRGCTVTTDWSGDGQADLCGDRLA